MPDISLYLTHDLTYSILRYHNNSFYYIYNLIHASAIKKPISHALSPQRAAERNRNVG